MADLTPFALKDAPALIEAVFPAQKVSFEAQKERKAGAGQTLTALGSFWKGRKPLILVRAVVLGSLLPQTGDPKRDLEVFELLMAFDDHSLAKRALIQNLIKPRDIAKKINLQNPWDYFSHNIKGDDERFNEVDTMTFPLNPDTNGLKIQWRRDIEEADKLQLLENFLQTLGSYEEKASLCKRPEELDQGWLYSHIWQSVSKHYSNLGLSSNSHSELIENLGKLRFGHRPKIGDTFSGGGSIPFEAARLGCDSYASDLNPIACMLSWGGFNIIGKPPVFHDEITKAQEDIASRVDQEILDLNIEVNEDGYRAKAYLYCIETRCPETGWEIPVSTTWVISKTFGVIAKLVPNSNNKRFEIEIISDASKEEIAVASKGSLQSGKLVYEIDGKTYRTPLKTIRGDMKSSDGVSSNRLRQWNRDDFKPQENDIFQERLYAIFWARNVDGKSRPDTYFAAPTLEDLKRESLVDEFVSEHFHDWQTNGLIPDMEIEPGFNNSQPIRERGWRFWHQLFGPRQLLMLALLKKHIKIYENKEVAAELISFLPDTIQRAAKLCIWHSYPGPGRLPKVEQVFSDQVLNTPFNWGVRGWNYLRPVFVGAADIHARQTISSTCKVQQTEAPLSAQNCDIFITDPPYADAVHYHEITEFFIAWLRKDPPKPFDQWTWDSRRALAVKGAGDDFRRAMVESYSAMSRKMPENGMQCVMFTHQDTSVWSDMIGIFWAAGLQVVGAWYIATETNNAQKNGGYVQGTVILMLRKRPAGENAGFKQRLLPAVRAEVKNQIETMMHLNDEVKDKMGEPVFNDSDLQMAGYAAALKVLTSYTHIGGEDVTTFALRPRTKGETTVVDEIVQQAAEAANSLLVPEGLSADTWQKLSGIQRFYLRMMDIETTGAAKLDNYQNFAKAFRVEDYSRVMGSMAANKAQLKRIPEFASRDLTESNEIGSTWLGHLIIGLQQLLAETDPQAVISQLQADLPDFMEIRALLIDVLTFVENKAPEKETRDVAEVLGARLKNMRALGN